MNKDENLIQSFDLKKGQAFAGYRIDACLGRGWTAEVYLATEIPTSAKRAIKIFENYEDQQRISQQKRVFEYAAALEKLSVFSITPRYHHLGHAFILDPLGNYFVVQEYIHGGLLAEKGCSKEMIEDFLQRLRLVHDNLGFLLRDWDPCNFLVTAKLGIRMIDADLGTDRGVKGNIRSDYNEAEKLLYKYLR